MTFSCPALDLSHVDLRRLDSLRDLPRMAAQAAADIDIDIDIDIDEAKRVAREATYTAVGFGVLAFQRAQVQRRAIRESLQEHGPMYFATVSQQAATALDELRTLVNIVRHPGRASTTH